MCDEDNEIFYHKEHLEGLLRIVKYYSYYF